MVYWDAIDKKAVRRKAYLAGEMLREVCRMENTLAGESIPIGWISPRGMP